MTEIFCAAAVDEHGPVPGVAPCRAFGDHLVTCPDHDMFDDRPGTCHGCAPQPAQRGFLCQSHYEWSFTARTEWDAWKRLVLSADGRTVSPTGGSGGAALGYTNLTLAQLALDECHRHLESSLGVTFDVWVSTYEGAADALMFAQAANRAYRALEVEYREPVFEKVPCESCGRFALQGFDTTEGRGWVVVTCDWCGAQVARIRRPSESWTGSRECNSGLHVDCEATNCGCSCHAVGPASRRMGVAALFDADLAAWGAIDRGAWIAWPDHRITEQIGETA